MIPDPAEKVLRATWRAFEHRGLAGTEPLLSEDIVWRPFADREICLHGREAVHEFFDDMAARGESIRSSLSEVECQGERLLAHGRLRHEAPGRITDEDVWWVCEVRDGKLARAEAHHSRPS